MAKTKTGPKAKKKLGGPRPAGGGPREGKAATVAMFKERLAASGAVLLTEYRGLTVGELAELRHAIAGDAEYKVVKNTLATIAVRESGLTELVPLLEGPTAAAFITGDFVKVAKDLAELAKRAPSLTIKGGLLEGRLLSAAEARALATLESREVLLAKFAGLLVTPIQQTANLFAAGLNQLGAVLAQLRDQKAAADEAA